MTEHPDPLAKAALLREQAEKAAELGKRHPPYLREAERLRARADRVEAGDVRTAEDFVEDYNDAEQRLHTTAMVDALVEHAEEWEAEVRADAYARALVKARADLFGQPSDSR